MRTLGILGGMGPESTIDYYRSIIATYQERRQDGSYPQMLIRSIDVNRVLQLVAGNAFRDLTSYLSAGIKSLAHGGAEFAIISVNTPHIVFDEVASAAPIPLLSIVRATCDAAIAAGLQRLALFGCGDPEGARRDRRRHPGRHRASAPAARLHP